MIVVDASCVLELLLNTSAAETVAERLFGAGEPLHAPHLLDLEVAQVLRRYTATRLLPATRGAEALADLANMRLQRWSHEPLLPRIWQLRDGLTAYDAAYVALAEALGASLVTMDRRAAAAKGHGARVEVLRRPLPG